MAKKLLKKIAKAAVAAGAAYGMSKAMAGKKGWRSHLKHTFGKAPIKQVGGDASIAEGVYGARFHKPDPGFLHKQKINILRPKKQGWKEKIQDWWSNTPWPKMYQGDLVKSQTRGTGAAVKGTTHEIMPGMDAAKSGKMIHAKQGYYAREDESIGMRLGKQKSKHAKKVARDESYGDWGKRGKDWKVKKARTGTMVRTRGSNPDSSWTTQGGSVDIHTKLNGTLKTRTW